METPQLERRLTAILAADVHGYSRLMGVDETATLETLSAFRRITDQLIGKGEGRIANTAGDSVLAEFPTVLNAVRCAVAIQEALARENEGLPEAHRMQFRIGINLGDVMVKGIDIFGDGVNIAGRLEGLAEPGGICVSRGVRDGVRGKIPYVFEDLGVQTVKNIAHPIRAYRLRFREAEVEAENRKHAAEAMAQASDDSARDDTALENREIELAFWDSIKESEEADEFEAYLAQFPSGSFRALAETRLTVLRADERAEKTAGSESAAPASDVEMAFWDSIKNSESAADYTAYLTQFPEGAFTGLARARLQNPSKRPPSAADAASSEIVTDATRLELAFWDSMKHSGNSKEFAEYLKQFPDGTFAGLAKTRLEDLRKR